MTTPCNFSIIIKWGHADHKISTLIYHSKQLKFTETSLFGILPTDIFTDIDIWIFGLEYCDKFKAVIKNMNNMCNPTLFAITSELWAPYHNFSVYIFWYN